VESDSNLGRGNVPPTPYIIIRIFHCPWSKRGSSRRPRETARGTSRSAVFAKCYVVHCSFTGHYFTTCFGLTGHLQAYRCVKGYCYTLYE
jgi:hypothetical protein